jgi:Rrf2 family protein
MVANSRFAVAIHTLVALGFNQRKGVNRLSSSYIATSVNTNPVVIRGLLLSLKRAGLIESKEGRDGGVSLARSPAKITLDEIYAAVESESVLAPHKKPEKKECLVSCRMKQILPSLFDEVDQAVTRSLRGKTLKEVIDQIES